MMAIWYGSQARNFGSEDVVPEFTRYAVSDVSIFVVVLHMVLFHGHQVATFVVEVMGKIVDHIVGQVTDGGSSKNGVNPFCGHQLSIDPRKQQEKWRGSVNWEN